MTTSLSMPCTSLVYRLLTTRYGSGSIRASHRQNKDLWELLQHQPCVRFEKTKSELTHSVLLRVSGKLAKHLQRIDLGLLSLALHRHYITQLYGWMLAQTQSKRSASAALRDWYARNGVGEDDLSQESAYRGWLRFQKSESEKYQKSVRREEGVNVLAAVLRTASHAEPIKYASLQLAFQKEYPYDSDALRAKTRKPERVAALKVHIYLAHHLCGYSMSHIGRLLNRQKGTIQHHLQSVDIYLQRHPAAALAMFNILQQLQSKRYIVLATARRA